MTSVSVEKSLLRVHSFILLSQTPLVALDSYSIFLLGNVFLNWHREITYFCPVVCLRPEIMIFMVENAQVLSVPLSQFSSLFELLFISLAAKW